MKIIEYLVCLTLITFLVFFIVGSILHTNVPYTDFILSVIAANMIYSKCEAYVDKEKKIITKTIKARVNIRSMGKDH